MKTAPRRFGLVALIIIFLILYGYFSTLGQPVSLQSTPPVPNGDLVTIGDLGGSHLLQNLTYSDERTYYRIRIETRLNRPSIIADEIVTPKTRVRQVSNTEPIIVNGQERTLTTLGEWRIQADLSDTRTTELDGDELVPVFVGPDVLRVNEAPLTEIRLNYDPDGSTVQVLIGLSEQSIFRVDDDGAGAIYIDILK